jgi:hypothetical protein
MATAQAYLDNAATTPPRAVAAEGHEVAEAARLAACLRLLVEQCQLTP